MQLLRSIVRFQQPPAVTMDCTSCPGYNSYISTKQGCEWVRADPAHSGRHGSNVGGGQPKSEFPAAPLPDDFQDSGVLHFNWLEKCAEGTSPMHRSVLKWLIPSGPCLFTGTMSPAKAKGGRGKSSKQRQTLSSKAGLQFPVARLIRYLRVGMSPISWGERGSSLLGWTFRIHV